MKYQIVHALQKYLFNPPIKLLFALGAVLQGTRCWRPSAGTVANHAARPLGMGALETSIVAEHGTKAASVRNTAKNPSVRVKVREGLRTHWYTGTRMCSPMMIPASASAGWLLNSRRAQATPPPCVSSGQT